MRRIELIDSKKVSEVKKLLSQGLSQRDAAIKAGISQYTVWHINKGTYDTDKPLASVFAKEKEGFFAWD